MRKFLWNKESSLQLTLHPNINDKVLLVQATLQWHSSGEHSGLFTIGDIPEGKKAWLDGLCRKMKSYRRNKLESYTEDSRLVRESVCIRAFAHTQKHSHTPFPPCPPSTTITTTDQPPHSISFPPLPLSFSALPWLLIPLYLNHTTTTVSAVHFKIFKCNLQYHFP